jgi:hypothetical protein
VAVVIVVVLLLIKGWKIPIENGEPLPTGKVSSFIDIKGCPATPFLTTVFS